MKAEFAAEGLNDVYTYVCDGSKEEEVCGCRTLLAEAGILYSKNYILQAETV